MDVSQSTQRTEFDLGDRMASSAVSARDQSARDRRGRVFDNGCGPAVIVIPGVQGRWEWMLPGLRALSKRCRTVSYTLSGDFGSGMKFDSALGFDNFVRQLDGLFERT